jgi:1-acyl-sn-glycerol-3-phosphate acyltransferase
VKRPAACDDLAPASAYRYARDLMEAAESGTKPSLTRRTARGVRASWRILRVVAVAVKWSSLLVLDRRHRADRLARAHWLRQTCGAALRAFNVDAASVGVPPPNSVIVANHLGYLDVLALAALTPVVFVAKREIASWPVLGWFARTAGTCFIDRNKRGDVVRVGQEIAAALAAKVSVIVFLEATSSDGHAVLPFKSSLLEPVARNGLRAAPAAVVFAVPPGFSSAIDVCWWGNMTLPPHLFKLGSIPRVAVRVAWGEAVVAMGDRKSIAQNLREQVVALHARLCAENADQAAPLAMRPPLRAISEESVVMAGAGGGRRPCLPGL